MKPTVQVYKGLSVSLYASDLCYCPAVAEHRVQNPLEDVGAEKEPLREWHCEAAAAYSASV